MGGSRSFRAERPHGGIAPIIAIQPIAVAAQNRTFGDGSG
jgi:hypothetical protein